MFEAGAEEGATIVSFEDIIGMFRDLFEMDCRPRHVRVSSDTWRDAVKKRGPEAPAIGLYGVPVFIDDDLAYGSWEVSIGRAPEEK